MQRSSLNSFFKMNNYSLLKSRTFWTIVVMFLINGYEAISGQLPGNAVIVLNLLASVLANYFHLETAKTFGARN